jgi:Na+-transporting NADH:ubiquinone oxidoreductase subunit NqrC
MGEEPFQSNFKALSFKKKVVLVDFGKKSAAHEVDAISGATVTSAAVVDAANNVRDKWLPRLPKPGSEPAFQKKAIASEGEE